MLSTTTKSESDSHPASALEEIGNDALQFGESFIQASIQTPVNSVMQLVSLGHLPEIHLVAPDPNATGLEKQFQQAGSAAGMIADFMVLSKLADLGMSNFIAEPAMRQLPVSAVSGFVNGALVTPLAPGENQWNRLSNGLSQAAAFSAYSALSTRLAGPLSPLAGDTLVQIASRNAISGLVAGTIDTQAKSLLSGRGFADFGTTATNAGSWAVGGAFAGVGGRILSDVLAHRPITPFFNDVRLNDMSAPLQANQMIESTARTATGDDAVVSSTKLADG
ncbi:MAG TPA: hypothetical protein V6C72_13265, partial [Chroococcales cyanobacterium]